MTASTFVLGGVASLMQLYIFEREAHLALDVAAVQRLDDLKLSNGERLIPVETMDKLRQEASPEAYSPLDLQRKLAAKLSQSELENYWPFLEQETPTKDSISNAAIGTMFGAIIVVAGLVATLVGGWLGDRLRNRGVKGAYFHVAGWGTLAGFPFFVAILFVPFPLAWLFVFLAVFALFFNTGPANTILANVTRSKIRATAFAINILIIHALGDAISPLILGIIKDKASFQVSFLAGSFLIPVAGLLWVCGARYLDGDTARAEEASRQTSSDG
jgi:MFS family permease